MSFQSDRALAFSRLNLLCWRLFTAFGLALALGQFVVDLVRHHPNLHALVVPATQTSQILKINLETPGKVYLGNSKKNSR